MTLLPVLAITADLLAKSGIYPSAKLDIWLTEALKTADHYQRVMWRAVKDLYDGGDQYEFEQVMLNLIEGQLRRAWNAGMRTNGLNPAKDMTEEWEGILQDIMLSEVSFVPGLAEEILTARTKGAGFEAFRYRVDLWVARYNDVYNRAVAETAGGGNFEWELGETEHCDTCLSLSGIVASLKEWKTAGFKPQSDWNGILPNKFLQCKGFKCGCRLAPTKKRKSPKALDTLLNIGVQI